MNPHAWLLSDLPAHTNGPKVLTTFSCGGGSSMGYKRAGYDVVLANDIDPEMAWHYKRNLHPPEYRLCPIKDLAVQLPPSAFGVDLLDGSPPCSTFSTAGLREKAWGKDKHFREGQATQVLDDLFFDFLDLAEKARPRAIIAENVTGLVKGNAKGYVRLIFARLRAIGYRPQIFQLDASRCGVPQKRERVFVCAQRDDAPARALVVSTTSRVVSAGEATSDLVLSSEEARALALGPLDAKWWPQTAPGEKYSDAVERSGLASKLWSHQKLTPLGPAPTLTSVDTFKHWAECRALSAREWIRLGSFPDDYEAKSAKILKYMIGMSVPPKMAEVVARAVKEQWLT
jgi:DNA (cytosine-5)-methyltransferase 1